MKIVQIFTFLGYLILSNPITALPKDTTFTEKLLVKCIEDCLNNESSGFIGWSKDGKAAWLDFVYDTEPSGYYDIYVVFDNIKSNKRIIKEYCGRWSDKFIIDHTQIKKIVNTLRKNKIFYAPTYPKAFPIIDKNNTIVFEVSNEIINTLKKKVYTGPGDTIEIHTYKDVLIFKKTMTKSIKRIEVEIIGEHYFGDGCMVAYYYKSPYQNLIAVPYHATDIDIAGTTIFRGENGMVGCDLDKGFYMEKK